MKLRVNSVIGIFCFVANAGFFGCDTDKLTTLEKQQRRVGSESNADAVGEPSPSAENAPTSPTSPTPSAVDDSVSPTPERPSPSQSPTPTGSSTPAPNAAAFPIGVNLEAVNYYSTVRMFVDAAKTAMPWGTPACAYCKNAPVDAADPYGWPTGDCGTVFFSNGIAMDGTYALSFDGQAQIQAGPSSGTVTIDHVAYDSTTNRTTASITLGKTTDPNGDQLSLTFVNTRYAGTQTGIKNVHLIRPGYAADTTQVFTDEFLAKLKPFTVLRFMDLLQTNNNLVSHWADRTKPTDATQVAQFQNADKGIAWEHVIQLANDAGKDIWINIPALADDDYITQLATLIQTKLDTNRVVYVEYSNEVWNSVFAQNKQNLDAANAEVAAGNTPINDFGNTKGAAYDNGVYNQYYGAWRRTAKRLVEIAKIFEKTMGADAIGKRIKPVLAEQLAYDYERYHQLHFLEQYYAPVNHYIYAIAGAPYFDIGTLDSTTQNATPKQVLDALSTSADNLVHSEFVLNKDYLAKCSDGHDMNPMDWSKLPSSVTLARCYGIRSFTYEGGPDTTGGTAFGSGTNLNAKIQSQHFVTEDGTTTGAALTPNMGDLVKRQLGNWYGCGNDLYMYYNLTFADGKYGTWGLYSDFNTDVNQGDKGAINSPLKAKAVNDFAANPQAYMACP